MPAIQVRDLPQELYDQLVEAARRDHRSIAQETTFIIEEYCSRDHVSATDRAPRPSTLFDPAATERLRARHELSLRRISQLPGFEVPPEFPPVADILAAEREAR